MTQVQPVDCAIAISRNKLPMRAFATTGNSPITSSLSSAVVSAVRKQYRRSFATGSCCFIVAVLLTIAGCSSESEDASAIISDDAEDLSTPEEAPVPVVDSPLQLEESTGACVDTPPENDGWGWDGAGPCRISPQATGQLAQVNLSGITDVVLVTGQSNTLGSNTAVEEGLDDAFDRVYAWTEDGWDIANLRQVWDLGWHPRTTPDGLNPHNNFALHFGKQVAVNSDRVVAFIVLSAPGRPIAHWDRSKDFYQKIRFQVEEALSYLPHKHELDAILWHQGENNWLGGEEYRDKLKQLIVSFRTEPWYGESALFICGETHRAPVNADLNALNSDGDVRTACVSSLGVGVLPDLTHFDAAGLREIGRRYGQKYLDIQSGDLSSR